MTSYTVPFLIDETDVCARLLKIDVDIEEFEMLVELIENCRMSHCEISITNNFYQINISGTDVLDIMYSTETMYSPHREILTRLGIEVVPEN